MVGAVGDGPVCDHKISLGLLDRCRLYARNEERLPEKCWDGPHNSCPNNTTHRRARDAPIPFTTAAKPLSRSEVRVLELGPEKLLEDENETEVEYE